MPVSRKGRERIRVDIRNVAKQHAFSDGGCFWKQRRNPVSHRAAQLEQTPVKVYWCLCKHGGGLFAERGGGNAIAAVVHLVFAGGRLDGGGQRDGLIIGGRIGKIRVETHSPGNGSAVQRGVFERYAPLPAFARERFFADDAAQRSRTRLRGGWLGGKDAQKPRRKEEKKQRPNRLFCKQRA